jgi:hypothetical protein
MRGTCLTFLSSAWAVFANSMDSSIQTSWTPLFLIFTANVVISVTVHFKDPMVHHLPWLYIRDCSLKNAIYICFKITRFRRKFWVLKSVLPGSFNFCANLKFSLIELLVEFGFWQYIQIFVWRSLHPMNIFNYSFVRNIRYTLSEIQK